MATLFDINIILRSQKCSLPFVVGMQLRLDLRQDKFFGIEAKRLDADANRSGRWRGKRQLWWIVLERIQLLNLLLKVHRVCVPNDLEQGNDHCEDHEDVDHLHVGSGGQAVGDPDVAGDEKWKHALTLDLVATFKP